MPLGVDIRLIIITIFTVIFYAKLAAGADLLNIQKYSYSATGNNDETQNWIGKQNGNFLVLELDAIMIADFEILLDDSVYFGKIEPYEDKKIHAFNVAELQTNSFYVHEFWVNDRKIEGTFQNLMEWVEHLNQVTFINWRMDMKRGLLICDKENVIFSDFIVSNRNDMGKMKSFSPVSGQISKNILIEIPEGSHKVTVNNFVTGCSESKTFFVEKEMALMEKKKN